MLSDIEIILFLEFLECDNAVFIFLTHLEAMAPRKGQQRL